jgi:rod shape-determining protein MreD
VSRWWSRLRASFAPPHPSTLAPIQLPTGGIVSTGQPTILLRPANPLFVWGSIVVALLLALLPFGASPWVPDWVALALVFWNVHQPRRVGMAAAFVLGLLLDVHAGALLGEHALAYTLLTYGAIALHRRVQWFPIGGQMLIVLPLLLLAQAVVLLVRLWVGGEFPGWSYFLSAVVGTLLWPLLTRLLLAPQRRPLERDETRPL